MQIPLEEARALLENGDLSFIFQADLPDNFAQARSRLAELISIHPGAPFYAGLLVSQNPSPYARNLEILLFAAALGSPSPPVQREAALRLIPLILESLNNSVMSDLLRVLNQRAYRENYAVHTLRAAVHYRLGQYNDVIRLLGNFVYSASEKDRRYSDWDSALYFFSAYKTGLYDDQKTGEEIISILFNTEQAGLLRWVLNTYSFDNSPLNVNELLVIPVRLRPDDYGLAIRNLTPSLEDGGMIFFRHPASLIGYLGRGFQYTSGVRSEGADLFRAWSAMLDNPDSYVMDSENLDLSKFMVFFYAGRIIRAMGNLNESMEYFYRALEFAPNEVQSDAVYWYLLTDLLAMDQEAAVDLAMETIEHWNDMSTFSAIMDRIASFLVRQRQWDRISELYYILERNTKGPVLAQYAWIMGRAIEEGFIPGENSVESFFRLTFTEAENSIYYGSMAANKLGEEIILGDENPAAVFSGSELEFLLGFYEYGAASYARTFINARENELSINELRAISQAMAEAGRLQESINFTARYARRDDYELNRQDLYLLYPRLYMEVIERHAFEYGFEAEILFGLIHTESHFMANAVSRVGALGLSQLMPATAEDMAGRLFRAGGPDYRGANFSEPEINVHIGAFYLRNLTNLMGSIMPALIAYNGGQGNLRRWQAQDAAGGPLPLDLFLESVEFTETREYGKRVLSAAVSYGYVYYDKSMDEIIREIYRIIE